ncbi:MAG: NADP-dependent oxidoreductase [Actinomycetota bacterium]|nr:NADP-dependent oxidoreductase [Actinomycetota bacterium]
MVSNRVVQFSRFGGPDVLELVEEPIDEPAPGQVRISLRAAGLNPADFKRREGGPQYTLTFPAGIGRELAGVVEAVGQGIDRFSLGDEVFATVPDGAFQTHLVTDASFFARKPAELPWDVAGSLALVGQTAWDALASQETVAGDTIVISAAAGGVGGVLSQLAVLRGIRVIGSASPANHDWLRSRGIEPVEYGPGLVAEVRSLAPDGVSAAFDLHGQSAVKQFLELGIPPHRVNTNAMDPSEFGIRRVGRGPTSIPTLEALAALVVGGDIELPIAARFPFDDVADAFRRLETGHLRGKVVITNEQA